jgi:hypothetical protein
MSSFSISTWCCFRTIASAAEAAEVSANCLFSLATLEAAFNSGKMNFALTEQEHSGVWRWAIITPEGLTLDEGRKPTQAQAKRIAEGALGLVAA